MTYLNRSPERMQVWCGWVHVSELEYCLLATCTACIVYYVVPRTSDLVAWRGHRRFNIEILGYM